MQTSFVDCLIEQTHPELQAKEGKDVSRTTTASGAVVRLFGCQSINNNNYNTSVAPVSINMQAKRRNIQNYLALS